MLETMSLQFNHLQWVILSRSTNKESTIRALVYFLEFYRRQKQMQGLLNHFIHPVHRKS